MTKAERSRVARLGGKAAHKAGTAHEWTPEEAVAAGRKGGQTKKKPRAVVAAVVALWLCAVSAHAQTATPASSLAWDQPGQTAAVAQGAAYKLYLDASTTGAALATVTCTAAPVTGPVTCASPFPAMTPGVHTLAITQTIGGVESAKSTTLSVTLVVVVTPVNVRIVP